MCECRYVNKERRSPQESTVDVFVDVGDIDSVATERLFTASVSGYNWFVRRLRSGMLEASTSGTRAECAASLVYFLTPETVVMLHYLWMKQLVGTQVKGALPGNS